MLPPVSARLLFQPPVGINPLLSVSIGAPSCAAPGAVSRLGAGLVGEDEQAVTRAMAAKTAARMGRRMRMGGGKDES